MNLRSPQPERDALFDFGHDGRSEPATELEATLARVQRAAGAHRDVAMPTDLKHALWEDLMNAHTAATAALPPAGGLSPVIGSGQRMLPTVTHIAGRTRWTTGINTLLAAALILALAGGVWRVAQDQGFGPFGNGPEPSSIPFGGFVQDDGSIDPADLPTAEDCTVEPLTVDEVLWYVTEPYEASYSLDMENIGPMPTEVVSATPPATNPPNYEAGPPSQADLDAAAETQRMWMSCILAESYFQVWALEEPFSVRDQITSFLPALTGVEEARAILEDLRDNGPSTGGQDEGPFISFAAYGYPGWGGINLITTDPANAWQDSWVSITAGYTIYDEDGTVEKQTSVFDNGAGTPVAPDAYGFLPYGSGACHVYTMTWNEARGIWLVSGVPNCG